MGILKEDIAQRISEERERIGYNQAGFARQLEVTAETLRRYELGLRDASLDFLVKAATLGVDVQYVLTGIRSNNIKKVEKALEPVVNIEAGASANVIQNANAGSIINFNQKFSHTTKAIVKPNEDHISDQQKAILTKLVNDIVELENQLKQKPKTHRSVWMSLNKHCKVTSYHFIPFENYEKAEKYLRMWIGRLNSQKTAPIADNEEWRKRKYAYIKINTKNQQDWIESYLQRNFKTKSLSDLTDAELDKTYKAVASKRQKVKKTETGYAESLFLWVVASFAILAWFFGVLASLVSSFSLVKSMPLGTAAIVFWLIAVVIAILGSVYKKSLVK